MYSNFFWILGRFFFIYLSWDLPYIFFFSISTAKPFSTFPLHHHIIPWLRRWKLFSVFISRHLSLLTFLLLGHYALSFFAPQIFSSVPPFPVSHALTWHIRSHLISFSCSLPSVCPLAGTLSLRADSLFPAALLHVSHHVEREAESKICPT